MIMMHNKWLAVKRPLILTRFLTQFAEMELSQLPDSSWLLTPITAAVPWSSVNKLSSAVAQTSLNENVHIYKVCGSDCFFFSTAGFLVQTPRTPAFLKESKQNILKFKEKSRKNSGLKPGMFLL